MVLMEELTCLVKLYLGCVLVVANIEFQRLDQVTGNYLDLIVNRFQDIRHGLLHHVIGQAHGVVRPIGIFVTFARTRLIPARRLLVLLIVPAAIAEVIVIDQVRYCVLLALLS